MSYYKCPSYDNTILDFPTIEAPISGSIVTFNTSMATQLFGLKVGITAQQAGTGTPSPQNVRSISGFSSVTAKQYGKNLLPNLKFQQSTQAVVLGWNAYAITTFLKAGTYTFSCDLTTAGTVYGRGENTSAPFAIYTSDGTTGHKTGTFTTTEDNKYRFYVYNSNGISESAITNFQIEAGSSDTGYELYKTPNTITVNLGDTYYGGVVDVKNGTATITQKYFSFTSALYYGTYGADDANLYYVDITGEGIKQMALPSQGGTLISNMLKKSTGTTVPKMKNYEIRTDAYTPTSRFYFRADDFADLTALNAFLAVTPMQVVAELQTPIEVTGLTADNFTTLVGENNIFADSGDILELQYIETVQEYLNKHNTI